MLYSYGILLTDDRFNYCGIPLVFGFACPFGASIVALIWHLRDWLDLRLAETDYESHSDARRNSYQPYTVEPILAGMAQAGNAAATLCMVSLPLYYFQPSPHSPSLTLLTLLT